jgi:hypothetical protein
LLSLDSARVFETIELHEYNKAKSAFAIRRRTMTKPVALTTILLMSVLFTTAQMKDVYIPGVPPPPPSMDPDHGKTGPDDPRLHPHVDPLKLQQEADDLARTAQTIPSDVASVRRGALPKDTIQKLREIEKLSKRLRNELNP